MLATGSAEVDADVELDGAPFAGPFRSRAGEDGFLPNAVVRLVAPIGDAGIDLLLDVSIPVELFEAGYHPLHSFESFGIIGLLEPSSGQYVNLGLVGDGGLQLDEASLQPGGRVSGRLTARASYFLCASTVLALAAAEPPVSDETPVPEDPPGDTGEEGSAMTAMSATTRP